MSFHTAVFSKIFDYRNTKKFVVTNCIVKATGLNSNRNLKAEFDTNPGCSGS
jgi:hypothetical protein